MRPVADRSRANGRIPDGNCRSLLGLVNPASRPKCRQSALAAKPLDEDLRRARAHRRFEDLPVIQPRLEVIERCLYHHGGLESFRLHPVDRFGSEIIHQAQAVEPCGTDVNMRALGVFVTEPLDGCLDLEGALPFPENHLAGVASDAEVKTLAAHRAELYPHQPFDDHGRFLASILTLLLGHRARCRSYGRPRNVLRMARSALQLLVNTGSSRSCSPSAHRGNSQRKSCCRDAVGSVPA